MKHPRLTVLKPRIAAAPPRIRPPPKTVAAVYLTPEWKRLTGQITSERGRACERCGRTHDGEGSPIRIFRDHVVELQDGGAPLDQANVMLLCGSCHTKKTNEARARRMATRFRR